MMTFFHVHPCKSDRTVDKHFSHLELFKWWNFRSDLGDEKVEKLTVMWWRSISIDNTCCYQENKKECWENWKSTHFLEEIFFQVKQGKKLMTRSKTAQPFYTMIHTRLILNDADWYMSGNQYIIFEFDWVFALGQMNKLLCWRRIETDWRPWRTSSDACVVNKCVHFPTRFLCVTFFLIDWINISLYKREHDLRDYKNY